MEKARQPAGMRGVLHVCVCVLAGMRLNVYYSCCGNINRFTQSHCGDLPSFSAEIKSEFPQLESLHSRMTAWVKVRVRFVFGKWWLGSGSRK